MKRIGVSASPALTDYIDTIKKLVILTREYGAEVFLEDAAAKMLGEKGSSLAELEKEGLDMLVTIGGDGTVLRALQHCSAPIFGVHMGKVGFLNEVEPERYEEDLKRVLDGKCSIDLHTRIQMSIDGVSTIPALNEVVIHSSQAVKMREFTISLDGDRLDYFRADGLIIATPTGSTGYAMSAGGPLLDPRLEGMLIMPLAPFRVAKRPNVVPLDSIITVEIANHRPCIANIDGQKEMELSGMETLEITNAKDPAKFLRFESNPYRVRQRAFETIFQ